MINYLVLILFSILGLKCSDTSRSENPNAETIRNEGSELLTAHPLPGANSLDQYLPLLKEQKVGLVINQTSLVGNTHLVDTLIKSGVNITTIFAPEHGFRGDADAGADIHNTIDKKTNIPIISIYGQKKTLTGSDLADIDILIFDIQDVGARFYTYISSMKYVMDACAKFQKPLIILDRPNPNGHYVDGPVLEKPYESFVGIVPIPIVHGMTVGELAKMFNEEGWLENGQKAEITIIPCLNYTHQTPYTPDVKPSPNLPNELSILLYPSLCLLEGTQYSVGRGTDKQFQIYGSPGNQIGDFYFTPVPKPGALSPFLLNQKCRGVDLSKILPENVRAEKKLNLSYIMKAFAGYSDKSNFFLPNHFIDKLAGTNQLRTQIINGSSEQEIRQSWEPELQKFKDKRNKYLIYSD